MTEKEEKWKEKQGKKGMKDRISKGAERLCYDHWKEISSERLKPRTPYSHGI